jgi:hypothetical protein
MLLHAHCLESITDGSGKCPVLPADAQLQQEKEQTKWQQDDTKAVSIIACTLSKSVQQLILTCNSTTDIWDKLCAQFEHSSMQWLIVLIESFFQAQCDCKEDISTHVAKLQKLFVGLNNKLVKHSKNTLTEHMLTGCILSTLGKELDNFKDAIPTSKLLWVWSILFLQRDLVESLQKGWNCHTSMCFDLL